MKQSARVLIVEHDTILLLNMSECIEQTPGCAFVGHAASLKELERMISLPEHRHDIVLLNPFLPFDTLAKTLFLLRSNKRPREVIVVSRCAKASFIATAYRLGIFDYIIAPFTRSRLRTSLRECAERLHLLSALPSSLTQRHLDSFLYHSETPAGISFHNARKMPDQQRLLRILNALSGADGSLSLNEIALRTTLSRSTVWRCLRYLEENAFIGSRLHHEGLGRPSVHFFSLDASRSVKLFSSEKNEKKKV